VVVNRVSGYWIVASSAAGLVGNDLAVGGVIAPGGDAVAFVSLASNLSSSPPSTLGGSLFLLRSVPDLLDREAEGTVSIAGDPLEGAELVATADVTDPDGAVSLSYRWQMSADGVGNWVDLESGTEPGFTIASDQSQVGNYLRVVVTSTDPADGQTVLTSSVVGPMANVNDQPVLVIPVADQKISEGAVFSLQIPADAFFDADGDALSYSASLSNEAPLPGWLSFDSNSRTFSGTPGTGDAGELVLKVTVSDGLSSASDTFALTVEPSLRLVQGDATDDALAGTKGAVNVFTGAGGNDSIVAGGRADVAVYSGNRADYAVRTVAGITTVVDNRPGSPDGTDTLRGLNILRFADLQLFQNSAANRTLLAGQPQTYKVSNSESVQGTNAAEHFVVGPGTSGFLFVGANDLVDLSGPIDRYAYAKAGNQLQISDGVYTATLSVGGTFTLRTASGSTSVAVDFSQAGAIKMGGTQIVGSPDFDPVAAILDPANVYMESPPATLQTVSGTAENDTLSGSPGKVSLITGGPGNDAISGGNRADVAVFSGNRADYLVGTVAGVTTVTDNRPGSPDGSDTIRGINILRFADIQLFLSTAANKTTLAGQPQTYFVSNSQLVQGTNAAEQFVVAADVSPLVFVGNSDVVDLPGAIDSYSYSKTGTQLQISDGVYTTSLNVGGALVLRTASGSTTISVDFALGGAIKLGGTQIVGSSNFDPLAAITDPQNFSDNAIFADIDVLDGQSYQARVGVDDVFIVDAALTVSATIKGFAEGDRIVFNNRSPAAGITVDPGSADDGTALLVAGNVALTLAELTNDNFSSEADFEAIYGPNAISYVI
jgi:hypothetical protein